MQFAAVEAKDVRVGSRIQHAGKVVRVVQIRPAGFYKPSVTLVHDNERLSWPRPALTDKVLIVIEEEE